MTTGAVGIHLSHCFGDGSSLRIICDDLLTAESGALCKEGVFYEVSACILFNIAACMNPVRFDILVSLRRRLIPVRSISQKPIRIPFHFQPVPADFSTIFQLNNLYSGVLHDIDTGHIRSGIF